jgi:hypothetical protein
MAIRNRTVNSVGYGLTDALTSLAPLPINANRAPIGSDTSPVGTLWCWPANAQVWVNDGIINGVSQWLLLESSGGPGVFTSLVVTPGPVTTSGTGAVNISADAAATTVNLGTGAAVKTVTVGSTNSTSATTIQAGSGGLTVNGNAGTLLLETAGHAITVASGVGEIDISADAAATTVKVGTGAGVKTVTLGSVNTTSTTTVQSGSGALNVTATNGAITMNAGTGTITVGGDATTSTIDIGTGAGDKTVNIGSTNTASGLLLTAGTSGILIDTGITVATAGNIAVTPSTQTIASPTATVTENTRLIQGIFTGFSTASAGTQVFVVSSTDILTTSSCLAFVSNLDASGNHAKMAITGTIQAAGSLSLTCTNNGAGALGAGDNVLLTVWILD